VHLEAYTHHWGLVYGRAEEIYRKIAHRLPISMKHKVLESAVRFDKDHNTQYPPPRLVNIGGSPRQQQPGFQIISTCRTMYEERHEMFYSQNIFHLEPGPLIIASNYFDGLQPGHRNLIKSIVLSFTVADLTSAGFMFVEADVWRWKQCCGQKVRSLDKFQQVAAWTNFSMKTLRNLWRDKFLWLIKWPSLEKVELRGSKYKLIVQGAGMVSVFGREDTPSEIEIFWRTCHESAERILRDRFEQCHIVLDAHIIPKGVLDVGPVRKWLYTQGPKIRVKQPISRSDF